MTHIFHSSEEAVCCTKYATLSFHLAAGEVPRVEREHSAEVERRGLVRTNRGEFADRGTFANQAAGASLGGGRANGGQQRNESQHGTVHLASEKPKARKTGRARAVFALVRRALARSMWMMGRRL